MGHEVVCLDNLDPFYAPGVKLANLAEARSNPGLEFVHGDVMDTELLDRVFARGPELVIHLAALAGVRNSLLDPARYARVNIEGTVNLLERARSHGVGRFVFASSSSVYGHSDGGPLSEDHPALEPVSPYGASKRAGELVCWTFNHLSGMPIAALRFFTVYGPRQRPDMAIHKFAKLMLSGQPIPVYGDGRSRRDYTYVADIIDGIVAAAEHPDGFQIFNLGSSRPVELLEVIHQLGAALDVQPELQFLPEQPGDVRFTLSDGARSERVLGYRPQASIEEGIRKFAEWFRLHGTSMEGEPKP